VQFRLAVFAKLEQLLEGLDVAHDDARAETGQAEFLGGAGCAPASALAAGALDGQVARMAGFLEEFADRPIDN
jgi:hypothetical protein